MKPYKNINVTNVNKYTRKKIFTTPNIYKIVPDGQKFLINKISGVEKSHSKLEFKSAQKAAVLI